MDPRISKQRTALVLDEPFFGALALRLVVVEDPSCKTFWVDGVSMGYNPAYLATLNDLEVRGVIAHEIVHVANGHCWRKGDRDDDEWNDACDYVANPIVTDAGMILPKGVLLDPRYRGKSAEEVYAARQQERRQKGKKGQSQQSGNGASAQGMAQPQSGNPSPNGQPQPAKSPGSGMPQADNQPAGGQPQAGGTPGSGQSPAGDQPSGRQPSCGEVRQYTGPNVGELEAEWKVAVLQAAKAAKMRGALPGSLEAMVSEAVAPSVDWRAILHRFAQQSAPTDYSYAMPNRRFLHLGLYLPSLHEPAVGDAVFVRDSSGSVFDETQAQFAAEILAVNENLRPRRLIVLDCDARVTQMQVFERGEPVDLAPVRGGGGTSFVDPFKRLASEDINPAFLVYLTDMDGTFPDHAPHYPVLWASTTPLRRARQAPFGEAMEVIV